MLTPHLLIWLVSASPPPLVTRLSIPLPLAGGWRHRSPGRSCLWRPRPLSPASISSALASERNIYCSAPGPRVCVCPAPIFGGFMWEYCGLLHHPRAARDREELCIIKCHKIWAWPVSRSDRSTPSLRHSAQDLNWRVSTCGGCYRGLSDPSKT